MNEFKIQSTKEEESLNKIIQEVVKESEKKNISFEPENKSENSENSEKE